MKKILVMGLLLGGTLRVAGQDLLTLQNAQFEWRDNCLASQSFAAKTETELALKTNAQKELEGIQKNSQEALLACASKVGVKQFTSELELQKSIMACPNEYEEWAKATPARLLLKAELQELSSQLTRIKKFIAHSCVAMN